IGYRSPTASRADLNRAFAKLRAAARPVREVEPNLFVMNPLAIPVYDRPMLRSLNCTWLRHQVRAVLRRLGFRDVLNWTFNPAAAIVAGEVLDQTLIYHCVDDYAAFSGVRPEAIDEFERRLVARADLVIVSAERLLQARGLASDRTVLVRH